MSWVGRIVLPNYPHYVVQRGHNRKVVGDSITGLGLIMKALAARVNKINLSFLLLAAIGLRALIEAVCKERGITAPNLEKLIDGLATNGILSQVQASILHDHRFLGNTAAHEIISPNPREPIAAVEIAETVMRTIYVLPELSKQITTGKRPNKWFKSFASLSGAG